jgi:hypothetical protein
VQELEWFFKDRTQWGTGAWDNEPDKVQWTDTATGLPCLIHRNYIGSWCGYVGVSPDLLTYLNVDDLDELPLAVHGGITFTNTCLVHPNATNGEGICHVPEPGEPDSVFWFGFDCAHYMDLGPADVGVNNIHIWSAAGRVYRDMAYVKAECESLAKQLIYIG